MKPGWILGIAAGVVLLSGCAARTPYFLIESRLVEGLRASDRPDVTETSRFRAVQDDIRKLGLRPPDVCADQGMSQASGAGALQLGVLRTRCGVEMAELERALTRAGYEVVSWSALRQRVDTREQSLLEAASALGIDLVLQVNALERMELRPGRDARWERSFYRATQQGEPRDTAAVSRARAADFDRLIGAREASLQAGSRVGASINVSGVWVESGSAIWFYEWTRVDEAGGDAAVELLLDCEGEVCSEVRKPDPQHDDGPVTGSVAGVSQAGDPGDQTQAIFASLVRELVTDLAGRLAGEAS